jgi:dTDP-D-glucose 4,6-dehydratase
LSSGEQERKTETSCAFKIVDALTLAAEEISDGSLVNAGRDDRITINEAAELIFSIVKWRPKVKRKEGFEKTIKWHFVTKNVKESSSKLKSLTER